VTLLRELNLAGSSTWDFQQEATAMKRKKSYSHLICTKCKKVLDPNLASLADMTQEKKGSSNSISDPIWERPFFSGGNNKKPPGTFAALGG
jgi:Fe2+ or Zn2+ uptake regulation protein